MGASSYILAIIATMQSILKAVRQVVVLATGIPIVILGLILIPLPGPGLLVVLGGLLVLSLEFEWARKHARRVRAELKKIVDMSKPKS